MNANSRFLLGFLLFWLLIYAPMRALHLREQGNEPQVEPVPNSCPTCGSEERDFRWMVPPTPQESERYGMAPGECIMCGDPWHQETAHGQEEEAEEEAQGP